MKFRYLTGILSILVLASCSGGSGTTSVVAPTSRPSTSTTINQGATITQTGTGTAIVGNGNNQTIINVGSGADVKKSDKGAIVLTPKTGTVDVGATISLLAVATSADGAQSDVTWSSSDNTKATVSGQGIVAGIAAGDVTITATSKSDS